MEKTASTPELNLRQLLRMFRWTFSIFWQLDRFHTVVYIVLEAVVALQEIVNAYIMGAVIDALTRAAVEKTGGFESLLPWLVLMATYNAVVTLLYSFQHYARSSLRVKSNRNIGRLLYEQVNFLGIQTIENPAVSNKLQRAENGMGTLWPFLEGIVQIFGYIITLLAAGLALLAVIPWMLPVLVIVGIIRFLPNRYYSKREYRLGYNNTEKFRSMSQDSYNLRDPKRLLEVTVNGGYGFFDKRFQDFSRWYTNQVLGIKLGNERSSYATKLIEIVVTMVGCAFIFHALLEGVSTVGRVTAEFRALGIFSSAVSSGLSYLGSVYEYALQINDVYLLFQMKPAFTDGTIEMPRLTTPPEIKLNNVSFRYPDAEKLVFENLNLEIKAGEKVAIVGHNGAGKTTLVKLIARIYTPQQGNILINGINLTKLKIDDWYKNIGILFQEYNHYGHLNVWDNVYIGRSRKPIDKDRVVEALKMADAYDFVQEYKYGLDQILGESYSEGIRPSTGQQQKLAIARFFYRNSPLVVFDEPTAAIDAVSEYNIFNKIYEFFSNKTVIIISHRFSTVRNADRIIVMDHGQVMEQGSHAELMQLNGIYAQAFKLQAEGYN